MMIVSRMSLGLFNLEANLSPQALGGDCLRLMENELQDVLPACP